MKKIFKKLIPSMAIALFVILQVPAPAQAATPTNEKVVQAADNGVQYLADKQNDDGSIPGVIGGETEWSVIAFKADGKDPNNIDNGSDESAVDYLEKNKPDSSTEALTIERKIIAISAAGKDTKDFGGTNYNNELVSKHDGVQLGRADWLNDDIFGVIAIDATDDPDLHNVAQAALDYFLSYQESDGGFSNTTDECPWCGSNSNDTAAAIIAIYSAEDMNLVSANLPETKDKKEKAILYLLSTRNNDGGFGLDVSSPSDGSSTSWALMALNKIGDSVKSQALAARNWLLAHQNNDGGFTFGAYGVTASDTYTTSSAVTALLGTTWLLDPAPLTGTAAPTPTANEDTSEEAEIKPEIAYNSASDSNQGSVLAATTSDKDQTKQDKSNPAGTIGGGSTSTNTEKSGPNYTLYGLAFLGLIAAGWFVIQSRQKQGI